MIKHSFSKEEYHPKDVTFEVTSMLMDEAKENGEASTFTGLIKREYLSSGEGVGYGKDKLLGFDPLTHAEDIEKYKKYEHERDLPYHHYIDNREALEQESKRFRTWKNGVLLASLELKDEFFIAIEEMLLDVLIHNQDVSKEMDKRTSIEQVKRAEKSRELGSKFYSQGVQKLGNGDMPHVQTLQHERANVRFRSI